MSEDRVIVCKSCEGGAALAEALRARAPEGVAVQVAECMNQCERPASLALRGPGREVYLFAGAGPGDVEDALALIALWRDSPGGVISDARAAGRLRHCLVGRVPA